jgi:hypothetical protein
LRVPITVKHSGSLLAFTHTGNDHWKKWDRFLTVEGKPAYHLGNICGTCEFLFERLEGANRSISAKEIVDKLREGLIEIDASVLDPIKAIVPDGDYVACLLEVSPKRVLPGSQDDYFAHEQIDVWGIDGFWGLPHYPKTEYYRNRTIDLGDRKQLFEFIVPMYPGNWLNKAGLTEYQSIIETGQKPTALAIAVLDIKEPARCTGEPEVNEHWCLAHYMLDGHHKMFAASEAQKPLTLLSLLSLDESLASKDEIASLISKL